MAKIIEGATTGPIIQKIVIDARNIEPVKTLMVALGKEYDNLPESVKQALAPLLEDDEEAVSG